MEKPRNQDISFYASSVRQIEDLAATNVDEFDNPVG